MSEKSPGSEDEPSSQGWLQRVRLRRASKEAGDVIAAQIGDSAANVTVGKNILQIGSIKLPRWLALAMLLGTGVVAFAAVFLVLRSLPERTMPDGAFNIAVVEPQAYDINGAAVRVQEARERAMSIAGYIREQKDVLQTFLPFQVEVWGPDRLSGQVVPEQAGAYAAAVNADVLVYGSLHQVSGERWEFRPEFYLTDRAVEQAAELRGEHRLGAAVEYHPENVASLGSVNTTLQARVKALVQLLQGISHLSLGTEESYRESARVLKAATEDPAWGAARDGTGQEVLYLFLGNAYISQATQSEGDERVNLLIQSRDAFTTAVALNHQYARGYNGLGFALYQMALVAADPCQQEALDEVAAQFRTALGLPAAVKPESGYVDYKATWGLGRVAFLRGICGDAAAIGVAQEHYRTVVDLFESIPQPFHDIIDVAISAHAELGTIAFLQSQGLIEPADSGGEPLAGAINHFEQAVELAHDSDTAESTQYRNEMLPFYLQALCVNGQADRLHEVADEFGQSPADVTDVQLMIDADAWKECSDAGS